MIAINAHLALAIAAVALAGFVQSVTGFGFGLLSMALLPLLISFQEAYFMIVIPNLVVCAMNFLANYRQFQWRHGLGLLVGSSVAVPVGYYTMIHAKSDWLMCGMGVLICLFSASELLMPAGGRLKVPESVGWVMGLFSGYLSGAFNMGGPPAVAYVYSQPWPKEHRVAVLQLALGASSVIRLTMMQRTGQITGQLLLTSLLVTGSLLLAIYGGHRLLKRIAPSRLRLAVFLFLLMIGTKYILRL